MTIDQFMSYSPQERASMVLTEGREILDRIFMYYIIRLYKYSDFYVELWYQTASNRIDKILVVDLEDVLHLYEKNIDISDLFK
ncbi:MAG TPA: hypothetical protein PLI65_00395 [Bacteroidales bacterium]|nr:hypothetical protein [Bacteroidales bacterium]HPR58864.1 hypothetical protein [Bacteroidales bacterium]HRW96585.1 hypothetical protein [Bacteroidales bacterium]